MQNMHANAQKLIIFFCVILFIASWSSFLRQNLPPLPSFNHETPKGPENPIYNSTLGVSLLIFGPQRKHLTETSTKKSLLSLFPID